MKVLFQAIYNKWDADAALKAAMPGLYNTAAPQDTDMPYGVFLLLSQDPDDTFKKPFSCKSSNITKKFLYKLITFLFI